MYIYIYMYTYIYIYIMYMYIERDKHCNVGSLRDRAPASIARPAKAGAML